MQGYEEFIRCKLSQLRESNDNQVSRSCSHASSSIRFHGSPILPPLLSGEQRQEIQRHREAARMVMDRRKSLSDSRMSHVHNLLHSIQLRQAPTLEEFFQGESGLTAVKTSVLNNISNVSPSQNDDRDSLSLSSMSGLIHDGKVGGRGPPLTSTAYSAFTTNDLAAHLHPKLTSQSETRTRDAVLYDQEESISGRFREDLGGQRTDDPLADISRQTQSSGYVTNENVEAVCVSTGTEPEESIRSGLPGGTTVAPVFFSLHNTSNTITMVPDIISHPPVDGDDLEEKCAEKQSLCDDVTTACLVEEACITSSQHDDFISAHPDGESLISHFYVDNVAAPPTADAKMTHPGTRECVETFSHHEATTDKVPQQSQAGDEERPYQLSLQTLLKKSREERWRQRQLRNQAKVCRTQERNEEQQQQQHHSAEEHSFSDKENYEFSHKLRTLVEGSRDTLERRKDLGNQVQFSTPEGVWKFPKEGRGQHEDDVEKSGIGAVELNGKSCNAGNIKLETEDVPLGGEDDIQTPAGKLPGEDGLAAEDILVHLSLDITTQSKLIDRPELPQSISAVDSPAKEAFYLTRGKTGISKLPRRCSQGGQKFQTVPTPQFCMSPSRCKSQGSRKSGGAPKRKLIVNTPLNVDNEVRSGLNDARDQPNVSMGSHIVPLVVGGDLSVPLGSWSSDQTEQIAQLEMNLSSLKDMISNLEYTLTETPENQTLSSQADLTIDQKHNNNDYHTLNSKAVHNLTIDQKHNHTKSQVDRHARNNWEDSQTGVHRNDPGSVHRNDQRSNDDQREEFADNLKYKTSPREAQISELDRGSGEGGVTSVAEVACTVQGSDRGPPSLVRNISGTGGEKQPDGFQHNPTHRITSLVQKRRVPNVFRKVLLEMETPHKSSVLSDTSNHPIERQIEGEDSGHFLSLNQSYDVDTPSGLWFQGESRSGSRDPKGKQLTPEYKGWCEGGWSRAKRRLVMHMTEGNNGRGGSMVRVQSSTPKAVGRGCGQEQLMKQAHAAQFRSLKEEQHRQQQELLQMLAVHYRLLQSVSFPCPTSRSRLRDEVTSLPLSISLSNPPSPRSTGSPLPTHSSPLSDSFTQPPCVLWVACGPLVVAAVKGFLTRRLLGTGRVGQLRRTIKDTQQFLLAFRPQTPGRGEFSSRQDLMLQERVTLQLRSARYEVHDIFLGLSTVERMQLISWDRELTRERELKRKSEDTVQSRGRTSLSAVTQKALERKRSVMIQKKAAERQRVSGSGAGTGTGSGSGEPEKSFRLIPQRVCKKTTLSQRPR